uniref:Uncharacterized protein n=1 Tax=Anguilla anguilla TaxID=7936 RepID=A0A0E9VJQ1_ANGAN
MVLSRAFTLYPITVNSWIYTEAMQDKYLHQVPTPGYRTCDL